MIVDYLQMNNEQHINYAEYSLCAIFTPLPVYSPFQSATYQYLIFVALYEHMEAHQHASEYTHSPLSHILCD